MSIQVKGWFTGFKPDRKYATDMAGFAINLRLFLDKPNVWFDINALEGTQETSLLTQIGIKVGDLEPKADNCTKASNILGGGGGGGGTSYIWHSTDVRAE